MSRQDWIDASRRVLAGETDHIRCPENDDDFLVIDWIPGRMSAGEFYLHYPYCDVTNYIRVSGQ
jgi:hypothetical protein